MPFELRFEEYREDATLTFARVPWDSELLGVEVVELRLREERPEAGGAALARWIESGAPRPPYFLYLRMDPANVALGKELADRGFYPVELTYELSIPLRRLQSVAPGWGPRGVLRAARESDLPALVVIARTAFHADRYHQDPQIPASRADARYASWIADAWKSGDPVSVYENSGNGEILGFFHWRPSGERSVDLSLAAVHPRLQGTGLGASMYEAVLGECRALGHEVATTRIAASNLDVVNLFARLGFSFRRARMTWHLHRRT